MTARRGLVWILVLAALQFRLAGTALAQNATTGESVALVTRDGVQLKITYFAGTARKGSPQAKQTTPIVFLHDYKGSRAVFTPLVQKLQATSKDEGERSFAAVTVDLRAHGESLKQSLANGTQLGLDAAKLSKDDVIAMATADMDAVRNYLVDKNDAGELNLNKLSLVGSGMGASVAANWALTDWSYPPLAVGKQGQDVKAIAMISPRWAYNGLSMQRPMQFRPLKENAAWFIAYGEKDNKFKADAERIAKQLERFHPKAEKAAVARPSGFTLVNLPTRLQGDLLLKQGAGVEDQIVKFLAENVASTQQPWIERRKRLP